MSDHGSEAGSRKTTISAAPTTLSAADEALLGTFMEVLAEGEEQQVCSCNKKYSEITTMSYIVKLWLSERQLSLVLSAKLAVVHFLWLYSLCFSAALSHVTNAFSPREQFNTPAT